jgi:TetR/AcrR family transcriptional regulator, transcriptional repressor for nem operon
VTSKNPPTRERILEAALDLVFERGLSATTVDAVLATAGVSKGAFFHHFPTKEAMGRALLEHYREIDSEVLEAHMSRAESTTDDPGGQLIAFIKSFEDAIDQGLITQPGCLFASYVYEQMPGDADSNESILAAVALWRQRILQKLEQAAEKRPLTLPVDLPSLADMVWVVFEGGFLLARATGDHSRLRDQLAQLRAYLTLLLGTQVETE